MIKLLEAEDGRLTGIFRANPLSAVRIAALCRAYGIGRRFFEVWLHNGESLAARLDDNAYVLAGADTDDEEMAAFLSSLPGLRAVYGQASALRRISAFLRPGADIREWNLLRLPSEKPEESRRSVIPDQNNTERRKNRDAVSSVPINKSPKLSELYDILRQAGLVRRDKAGYESWYADMSHRLRHGCARACTAGSGNPVSCCLVMAESDFAGLIVGVATVPRQRRHGYASALVESVCGDLRRDGKIPLLECGDDLAAFYRRLGFQAAGRSGRITLP